jgi:putative N6-adenine-specific DNA methylase
MASGWEATFPLLDPFCGSGTIAIEAALGAKKIPPGRARHFAFMDWPNFDAALWKALLGEK